MPVPIKKQEKYDFPKTEPNPREGQEEKQYTTNKAETTIQINKTGTT